MRADFMPQNSRLQPKEMQEMKRLISAGWSDAEIARKVGRSHQTVGRVRSRQVSEHVTTAGHKVSVRLTGEEFYAFEQAVKAAGLTKSDAIRRMIRNSLGVIDLQKEELEEAAKVRTQLVAIGRNVNQLASLANSGRLKWNERDRNLMSKVENAVANATDVVTILVNAARRRTMATTAIVEPYREG